MKDVIQIIVTIAYGKTKVLLKPMNSIYILQYIGSDFSLGLPILLR